MSRFNPSIKIKELNDKIGDLSNLPDWLKKSIYEVMKMHDDYIRQNSINIRQPPFNAKGDGVTDDTINIQSAINYVTSLGGGSIYLPNGTYMVKAHVENTSTSNYLRDEGGIALEDNIYLLLAKSATLKAIPNSMKQYQIIRSYGKKNVTINGGTIQGERNEHLGTTGEWGYGISIQGGSDITIKNISSVDNWGDGINIQVGAGGITDVPKNVSIFNVKCLNNRRQGMSIEGLEGGFVNNSIFAYTNGAAPGCGVNMEPWNVGKIVKDVKFENCSFYNNASSGMLLLGGSVSKIRLNKCSFKGNKDSEAQFKTSNGASDVVLDTCSFDNTGDSSPVGILFQNGKKLRAYKNEMNDSVIHLRITGTTNAFLNDVILDGNTLRCPTISAYEVLQTPADGNEIVIKNNVFDFTNNDLNERYFYVKGNRTKFSGNTLLNIKRGLIVLSPYAKIFENDIHGSAINAGYLNAKGIMYYRNTISGACHSNDNQPSLRVLDGCTDSKLLDNTFFQESMIPVSGTGKSNKGIDMALSLTGLLVKGNTSKPLDKSSNYQVYTTQPSSPDNFIQKGNVIGGATSLRPTRAYQGDCFYDITLNKPIWCKTRAVLDASGTIITPALWVDATGTIV